MTNGMKCHYCSNQRLRYFSSYSHVPPRSWTGRSWYGTWCWVQWTWLIPRDWSPNQSITWLVGLLWYFICGTWWVWMVLHYLGGILFVQFCSIGILVVFWRPWNDIGWVSNGVLLTLPPYFFGFVGYLPPFTEGCDARGACHQIHHMNQADRLGHGFMCWGGRCIIPVIPEWYHWRKLECKRYILLYAQHIRYFGPSASWSWHIPGSVRW